MDSLSYVFQALQARESGDYRLWGTYAFTFVAFITAVSWITSKEPPALWDTIPFVSNTLQYLTDNGSFTKRLIKFMNGRNLGSFWLGPVKVYVLTGAHNMQTLFGRGNKAGNEDIFVQKVLPVLFRMSKDHVKLFANDHSGMSKIAARGYEHVAQDQRYWFGYEHLHTEYVGRNEYFNPLVKVFKGFLTEKLDELPIGETSSLSVIDFCKNQVTESAMSTLMGPNLFKLNPDFLDVFWEFDHHVFMLILGPPRWLYSRPYKAQDRYLSMIDKYLESARSGFDWTGQHSSSPWEPHFGARVCREYTKWFAKAGLPEATPGALGTLLGAQNLNVIPATMWMILELARDSELLKAVREEVSTAVIIDQQTGQRDLDPQKLAALPLLQSVFTETLRLRMNFNIMRQVKEPMMVNGCKLKKGATLQAPMMIAHYDEAMWGSTEHPASEFWAERHIKYIKETDPAGKISHKRVFAMAGRPSSYFPFGGGEPICPGRHFAKHKIMTIISLLVSKFEFESVEWTQLDGSPSDRIAHNDQRFCGTGVMPPDRDMKIRWRRVW